MKKKKIIIGLIIALILVITILISLYFYGLTPVSNKDKTVEFTVKTGENKIKIVDKLYDAGLIKSKVSLYIYVGLNRDLNLQAGDYHLSPNMSAKDIIKKLHEGKIIEIVNTYKLTFVEGKRIVDYAKIIAKSTNTTDEEVINTLYNLNEEGLERII